MSEIVIFQIDYVGDTSTHSVLKSGDYQEDQRLKMKTLLSQLERGTEQLLFSFLLPSTLSTTNNIIDLQRLVTTGM